MRRLYTLLFIIGVHATVASAARDAIEDYDSLSRLPSKHLMDAGRNYFETRQTGKALACFSIVADRYRSSMDRDDVNLCIRALNNSGCVYKFAYYDYAQAYDCFTRAIDLSEEVGYDEFLPAILVNLGDLLNDYAVSYVSQPLARQANQLFEHCMEEAQKNKNWELMTTAFFNLSNQNFDLDLTKFKALFNAEIPDDTPDLQYVRLQFQGIEHMQKGRFEEARQCFARQLAVVNTRWEPQRDTLSTLMNIAHTYYEERNYAQAVDYLHQALQLSDDGDIEDLSANICKRLAENYKLMGNSELERKYHLLYLEKKETMAGSRLASIGELNYVYELKKEQEKAHEMEQRQRMHVYAMGAGALVLLVVIVSALLLWRKNRQLTARNKSLFEKTQQVIKAEAEQQKLRRSTNQQNSEDRESLILRIQEVLDTPEMVCQQDFTVARLAKLVGSNTTYVSQAINEKYGMAFSNVLGNKRINEACRRMNDHENYGNQTIEAIATSVGFKSRTAFVNAFKREVGLTPSEYLRMANEEENIE